jgi:hypothetical protein
MLDDIVAQSISSFNISRTIQDRKPKIGRGRDDDDEYEEYDY